MKEKVGKQTRYHIIHILKYSVHVNRMPFTHIKIKMKEKVSKLTYPMLQHCLRMLHIMYTTIMKGGIGQSGSKP